MTRQKRIAELERAANLDPVSVKLFDRNEVAEELILVEMKAKQKLAKKALLIIKDMRENFISCQVDYSLGKNKRIKELEAENKKLIKRVDITYIGLKNTRWMLKNPRKAIWELQEQLKSADLMAKEALELSNKYK